jgi:hypothetical protein
MTPDEVLQLAQDCAEGVCSRYDMPDAHTFIAALQGFRRQLDDVEQLCEMLRAGFAARDRRALEAEAALAKLQEVTHAVRD